MLLWQRPDEPVCRISSSAILACDALPGSRPPEQVIYVTPDRPL